VAVLLPLPLAEIWGVFIALFVVISGSRIEQRDRCISFLQASRLLRPASNQPPRLPELKREGEPSPRAQNVARPSGSSVPLRHRLPCVVMTVRGVFTNASERRSLDSGEVLFIEGESGTEMFGVIAGVVELRRGTEVVEALGAGETFGEMAIIDRSPRSLTAVAREPSEVAVIDERAFLFLVHETPTFALEVMRSLTGRVRRP
jgi:hypothetical protein